MVKELWKDVKGFEGLYQVSTLGRVRSLDTEVKCYPLERKPYTQKRKGRILKPYPQGGGHLTVTLYKDGVEEYCRVHRLVAIAFLENPMEYKVVTFKDGDMYNITLDNLRWGGGSKYHY